jgi:hypothetical protein
MHMDKELIRTLNSMDIDDHECFQHWMRGRGRPTRFLVAMYEGFSDSPQGLMRSEGEELAHLAWRDTNREATELPEPEEVYQAWQLAELDRQRVDCEQAAPQLTFHCVVPLTGTGLRAATPPGVV